jgi:hypothetical protein
MLSDPFVVQREAHLFQWWMVEKTFQQLSILKLNAIEKDSEFFEFERFGVFSGPFRYVMALSASRISTRTLQNRRFVFWNLQKHFFLAATDFCGRQK